MNRHLINYSYYLLGYWLASVSWFLIKHQRSQSCQFYWVHSKKKNCHIKWLGKNLHSQIYMFTFWLSTFSFLLLFNWLDFDSKNYGIFWKVWFEELWDVLKVKPCELYHLWLIIITLSHCILCLFFPIQSQINLICSYLFIHSVWVYLYLFNFISSHYL